LKNTQTGHTLCSVEKPILLESMDFPDPVISIAVEPSSKSDQENLGNALAKLGEEDPTFLIRTDEDTGQTIISGMGELHLEVIVDRLKREFNVECNQGAPQVSYKETLTNSIEHREIYKKQTGGRGKFADILFEIGPADEEGEGLQFKNDVVGGNIPKEFIPAIEKGFKGAMENGVLAGYPVERMKVRVYDGSLHPVDSDANAFELCARSAFRSACLKAKPAILEPIMKMEVATPDEYTGEIVGDLNRRRGQLEGMEYNGVDQVIKAKVPLSEMFGYVTQLRTMSSGRAYSSMEFSNYDFVPNSIAEEVIDKAKGKVKV
jgi:elongation factor G